MHEPTRLEIVKRLKADYSFKDSGGAWLRGGKCPDCGGKELYINADAPWILRCGRLNKCGHDWPTKSLYEDLFDNWSERHKQTPEDPHAAAKAYLRDGRGLNIVKLAGAFTQELYRDNSSGATSATVRFPMLCSYSENGPHNGTIGFWERIIDRPQRFGKKKANMPYGWRYAGNVWHHPGDTIEKLARQNEIWFAEGIFDCASLNEVFDQSLPDCRAVSTLSTNNYPSAFLAALADACTKITDEGRHPIRPTLVFAFDPGAAGVSFTRKYVTRAREEGWIVRAAQVTPDGEGTKRDWNDLLQHEKLTSDDIRTYLENGDITIAESAAEKAYLLYRRTRRASFALTFKTRQLWATFSAQRINELVATYDEDKTLAALSHEEKFDMAARESVEVKQIANCLFCALYFQNETAAVGNSSYYFRVVFPGKQAEVKRNFPGKAVSKAGPFRDHLISIAPGAIFEGTDHHLNDLMKLQLDDIRTVDALYYSGYSIHHKAWMFDDIAVTSGRVIPLNDDDFFEIGKVGVKPQATTEDFRLTYDPFALDYSWWHDFNVAFGALGTVTLAYWFLSMFAEQVRHRQQRLGFLELWGEAGSGKSTLIMFLWKLTGRLHNWEGINPAKATVAGLDREFVKYGNLPLVLIEGDIGGKDLHTKRFDWDMLKPLYNGHPPRVRGVANGGTSTFSPRFKGSLVIAQNKPVADVEGPFLERVMSLEVNKSRFGAGGKVASERLEEMDVDRVSHWIVAMIRQEKQILDHYWEHFKGHEARLSAHPEVKNTRLAFNHAQLATALDCLTHAMSANGQSIISPREAEEGHKLITQMCVDRHVAIQSDHPIIAQFWENFDWLEMKMEEGGNVLNWHRRKDRIAVHLTQFEQKCADFKIALPTRDMVELKKLLPASKSRKHLGQTIVNGSDGKGRHCWVFEKPAQELDLV